MSSEACVLVRRARLEDCADMGRVIVEATRDAFRGRVPDQCLQWLNPGESADNWEKNFAPDGELTRGARILVAERQRGGVVGLAMVVPTVNRAIKHGRFADRFHWDLVSLHVDPGWQRRGVGRRLVQQVTESVAGDRATGMLVAVLQENPNIAFYERLGARKVAEQPYEWEGYETLELLYGWDDIRMLTSLSRPD